MISRCIRCAPSTANAMYWSARSSSWPRVAALQQLAEAGHLAQRLLQVVRGDVGELLQVAVGPRQLLGLLLEPLVGRLAALGPRRSCRMRAGASRRRRSPSSTISRGPAARDLPVHAVAGRHLADLGGQLGHRPAARLGAARSPAATTNATSTAAITRATATRTATAASAPAAASRRCASRVGSAGSRSSARTWSNRALAQVGRRAARVAPASTGSRVARPARPVAAASTASSSGPKSRRPRGASARSSASASASSCPPVGRAPGTPAGRWRRTRAPRSPRRPARSTAAAR